MYTEFIIMYIGLGVLILLAIAILVLLILLFKKEQNVYIPQSHNSFTQNSQAPVTSGNIVFCKKCATEFNSSQRACPKCGTPR